MIVFCAKYVEKNLIRLILIKLILNHIHSVIIAKNTFIQKVKLVNMKKNIFAIFVVHISIQSENIYLKYIFCEICNKWLLDEKSYNEHLLKHPKCDYCGERFASELKMKSHLENIHKCNVCNNYVTNVNKHLKKTIYIVPLAKDTFSIQRTMNQSIQPVSIVDVKLKKKIWSFISMQTISVFFVGSIFIH